MRCIDFEGSNITLKGNGHDVYDIRARRFRTPEGQNAFGTLWELEPSDIKFLLECLNSGNSPAVQLFVIGNGFPPVALQMCGIGAAPGSNADKTVAPPAASTTIGNIPTEKQSVSNLDSASATLDQAASDPTQHESSGRGGLPKTDPYAELGKRLGIQRQQGVPGASDPPSQV